MKILSYTEACKLAIVLSQLKENTPVYVAINVNPDGSMAGYAVHEFETEWTVDTFINGEIQP